MGGVIDVRDPNIEDSVNIVVMLIATRPEKKKIYIKMRGRGGDEDGVGGGGLQGRPGPSNFQNNENKCGFIKQTIKVCVSCSHTGQLCKNTSTAFSEDETFP